MGPFDVISIIYANIQNPLCNFEASCLTYHSYQVYQNQTESDREETIEVQGNRQQQTTDDNGS